MGYMLATYKQDLPNPDILTEIEVPVDRNDTYKPTAMPQLAADEVLIFGADRSIYEDLFVIENYEEMLSMYQGYMQGRCMSMNWYKAKRLDILRIPRAS